MILSFHKVFIRHHCINNYLYPPCQTAHLFILTTEMKTPFNKYSARQQKDVQILKDNEVVSDLCLF